MGCCGFNAPGASLTAPDACKRVNYTLGMLLGVDDFVQESAYHNERRRELGRELLGYGTVHGLALVVEPDGDKGPRVRVSSGMAWLPSGTPVCVDGARCANLNDWLASHATEVAQELGSSSPSIPVLSVYAVLSHAECLTDNVPIPGEPCRSESELMQPSRVTDSFCLALLLKPPVQREEDAVRDFVTWLVQLPVSTSSPAASEDEFVAQLREAARDWLTPSSPPTSPPDYMLGSGPSGLSEPMFRAALRLWATELRPLWLARPECGCSAPQLAKADDAVLLAELRVPLLALGDGTYCVDDTALTIEVDESRRPVLLSLRMVQELITHHPAPVPGDIVTAETNFGAAPAPGESLDYARADHTHGTPELPELPELGGDLSGPIDNARIELLQGVPLAASSPLVDGQVLTVENGTWVPREPSASVVPDLIGDAAGPVGATRVEALRGVRIATIAPSPRDVLRFENGEWGPSTAAAQGEFVGRGKLPYEIVVAGEVNVDGSTGAVDVPHSYGGLKPAGPPSNSGTDRLHVELVASPGRFAQPVYYIVKLTPVWQGDVRFGFRVYLLEAVKDGGDEISFTIVVQTDQDQIKRPFRFQVEVSRFQKEPS